MTIDPILAKWNRLGATFSLPTATTPPDVELLLCDSAAALQHSARLYAMMVAWLARYEKLVCSHRLAVLASRLENDKQSAALGYLLTVAAKTGDTRHYQLAIRSCRVIAQPEPLFAVYGSSPALTAIARDSSTAEAHKWGLWAPPERAYDDAFRPTSWIMAHNPGLVTTAMFGGRLAASILTTLSRNPAAGRSESALARATNATRVAVRDALDHLELCMLVSRTRQGRNLQIQLHS